MASYWRYGGSLGNDPASKSQNLRGELHHTTNTLLACSKHERKSHAPSSFSACMSRILWRDPDKPSLDDASMCSLKGDLSRTRLMGRRITCGVPSRIEIRGLFSLPGGTTGTSSSTVSSNLTYRYLGQLSTLTIALRENQEHTRVFASVNVLNATLEFACDLARFLVICVVEKSLRSRNSSSEA